MMIQLTGRINEVGQLELDQPTNLPPGAVRVFIEMVDAEAEAADEARWDELFARSQDLLAQMADEAGLIEEFASDDDPDSTS